MENYLVNRANGKTGVDCMLIISDNLKNGYEYDGKTKKFGITVDNKNYIIKFAKNGSCSVYTEYIASKFMNNIGISAHRVEIGVHKESGVLVNVIEDFNTKDWILKQFKDLNESSVDTDIENKEYTYSDILDILEKISRITDNEKEQLIHRFWQMYLCDAILGNRDRHRGNWGFLRNRNTKEIKVAPIFDNGACLFPDIYKVMNDFINNEKEFLKIRTEKFPASLLMRYNRRMGRVTRTNYKEVLSDVRFNKVLAYERKQLIEKVGLIGVTEAVFNATNIDIDKNLIRFYRLIVILRYLVIIERYDFDKAYNKALRLVGD